MKNIFAIVFMLSSFIFTNCEQSKNENDTFNRIYNYLSDLEEIGFCGSFLVDINGEQRISRGYGFSNKESRIKNSSNTIFDIGSITKQFTAAAILKLEMHGKLSTNDKLSGYFDNIPKDKENITIHDLLRHQSGLISNVGRDYERITEEDFLNKVFSSSLRFESGTHFSYSNIGYSLLALIIEKVSGQDYETYLYENLWKPSHMEMTGYSRPQFDTDFIAVGYDRYDNIWGKPTDKEWDKTAPYLHLKGNGGILSNVQDLHKWHRVLLSEDILSKEAKQKMYHPELREEETEISYYAYGWDVSQTNRNTTRVWHNGSNNIFYADFLGYIDEDVVLIMLSNKSHPHFNGLNQELSKIIFNNEYIPEIPAADNELNRNFTNRIIHTIVESGLEKAMEEFKIRNTDENLIEFMMRNEGFNYIDNERPAIAIKIFEMNVYAYPESPKALQGLGEAYMETGQKELALKYFKLSLSINPENMFVKSMIKELEEIEK